MNTAERQERNEHIVELKLRGLSSRLVAVTLDVSRATVDNVMAEWREHRKTLRSRDPLDIVDDMLDGYQADLHELSQVSSSTKNESVRVGAVNSRMSARDRIIALLQATGVLPHDLGKLSVEVDIRYVAQQVITILEKYQLPPGARDELLAALGRPQLEQPQLEQASQN